jgi:hypothetical protein
MVMVDPASGYRDIEQLGAHLGVFKKQFVKISQAK